MKKTILLLLMACIVHTASMAQMSISGYSTPSCSYYDHVANTQVYDTNGVYYATTIGGQPPYNYTWNGPVTGAGTNDTIRGLKTGSYTVTAYDALGDSVTTSIIIGEYYTDVTFNTEADCKGNLTIIAEGYFWNGVDNGPYSYEWSTGATDTAITTNLDSTNFYVTVTDSFGCVFSSPAFYTHNIYDSDLELYPSINCNTGTTIDVSTTGDQPSSIIYLLEGPYGSYNSPSITGNTSYTFGQGLTGGTYILTAELSNYNSPYSNCQILDTFEIDYVNLSNNPPYSTYYGLDFEIESNEGPCADTAILSVASYSEMQVAYFDWYGGYSSVSINDPTFTITESGQYTLIGYSSYGCEYTATLNVPSMFNVIPHSDPASCSNDGSAWVNVYGDSGPYTFLWNTGATTDYIYNIPAGNYSVIVSNATGCIDTAWIEVENASVQLDSVVVEEPFCGLTSDGSIALYVSGINTPFSYVWSTGDTTSSLTNLSIGTYNVTVTDGLGCTIVQQIILDPGELMVEISIVTQPDCINNAGGALKATSLNGSAPYSYLWNNGSTTDTINNLSLGSYTISVTDSNGCGTTVHHSLDPDPNCFAHLSGQVYIDADSSCNRNTSDFGLNGKVVKIEPGYYAYTDHNGKWQAQVDPGQQYQIFVVGNTSGYYSNACSIDTVNITVPDTITITNIDFPLNPSSINDAAISLWTHRARPGFTSYSTVTISNQGQNIMNGTGTVLLDEEYHSLTVGNLPLNISIDSITSNAPHMIYFSYTNLQPYSLYTFHIYATLPTIPIIQQGDTLISIAEITNSLGFDVNLNNNIDTLRSIVTAAYDPNDKQVFSNEESMDGLASPTDTLLEYLVRFQNTGTDTAFNVVIRDTLDAALDPATFRLLGSSHPVNVQFYQDRIIHFNFNNILLPDSNVNEPLSHGFVAFEIEIEEPGLLQAISNQAAIYFDYNPPIYTNTVTSTPAEIPMITGATELCDGETLILRADTLSTFSYIWTDNGNPISGFTGDSLYVTTAGDYSLALILDDDTIWSASKLVTVNPLPSVSLTPALTSMCEDASSISLTVSPTGGVLTGDGISGTSFDPATAGVGAHQLTYEYTDGNNCSATAYETVTVNANPTATLAAASNSLCADASAISLNVSPTGGTLTGDGVSGTSFDPTTAGVGAHQLTYEYTDGNNCSATAYETVTVNANPTATLTAATNNLCEDASAVSLNVSPSGGVLTGDGVSGTSFDPATAGVGAHQLTYEYTDGNNCSATAFETVTVNASPTATFSLPSDPLCESEQALDVSGYGSPAGGVYSGSGLTVSDLDISVAGTYNLTYTYTDNNGCIATVQANAVVEVCIGIEEAELPIATIHPNPTNGLVTISVEGRSIDQVVLLDVTGKQIQVQPILTVGQATIDLSDLASGMYMLHILSEGSWYTERVVLQH